MDKKWTEDEINKLINLFEQNKSLWQKSHKDYKNKFKRANALEQIGNELGVSAADTNKKMHALRTTFLKIYNNQKKSGSGASKEPKWVFFEALLFLKSELTVAGPLDSLVCTMRLCVK